MIIAQKNGRNTIGAPDKLFGVSAKAKERISQLGKDKVIDSTIGVLLDDDGQLVVLDSVMKSIRALNPEDYAAYAPILGLPQYREAVKKAVFLDDMPTDCFVESCYTPGGTGALRNAVSAYTKPGDQILVSSWHWNPYNLIAAELGRTVRTYTMFDEEGKLNVASFEEELTELLKNQDETVIILNTPAHNPTGYTMTDEDWDGVLSVIRKFKDKKIAVVVDIAYLDFSGDSVEYRAFLKKLTGLPENILPLIAFSASKGYTMYGMRCGALLCMAPNQEIAKEFVDVMSVECRASWSNGNRAAMTALANIINNEELFAEVKAEREAYLNTLNHRSRIFMEEAEKIGLKTCPFDSGFFITVPCEDPDSTGEKLQENNLFAVALGKGIRISAASNTDEQLRKIPSILKAALK